MATGPRPPATPEAVTAHRPVTAPRPLTARRVLLGTPWPWVVLWLLTRGWMLHQWAAHYDYIANDVRYYFGQLGQQGGWAVILREYPLPVVWLLDLLRLPVAGRMELYVVVFALVMALLDAGFSVWLWQGHSRVASIYWMMFGCCLGPLVWFRYDLLAAVAVGSSVFLVARNPRASGALLALGAAIKLWPALLLAALVGRARHARLRTVWFAATGLALALLALVAGGPVRLVSPITWQQGRGLQIESVWASWPMWRRSLPGSTWQVEMSQYNAYEVFGAIGGWLRASDVAMALGVLFAVAVAMLALRHDRVAADVRALACLAVVAVMLVANKTLSPQYLSWLGAVSAAWLGLAPAGRQRLRAGAVAVVGLLLAALTQYVYPNHYGDLLGRLPAGAGATAALVARNLLLVGLALVTSWWTLAALLAGRRAPRRATATTHPGGVGDTLLETDTIAD